MKRFYKIVSFEKTSDGFFVPLLDGKFIKTPLKNKLVCSSELLCQKIVTEWDNQVEDIDQASMIYTQFVTTQIDKVSSPTHYEIIRTGFDGFIDGDMITYFNPDDVVLFKQQNDVWLPLLKKISASIGNNYHIQKTFDIVSQSKAIHRFWQNWFLKFDGHALNIIQLFLSLIPSPILCFLFVNNNISQEELFRAVHLEEMRQQEEWGVDPVNIEKQAQFRREITALAIYRDVIFTQ